MVTNILSLSGNTQQHKNKHQTGWPAVLLLHPVLQRQTIYLLSVFYCLCCLSVTSAAQQLQTSKLFILQHFFCWILVIETGENENCQYNETIFTPCALSIHYRANRVASQSKTSIAIVQKETYLCFSTRKGEIKHTLFFSYGKSRECPINPDRDSRVNIYVHKPDWH